MNTVPGNIFHHSTRPFTAASSEHTHVQKHRMGKGTFLRWNALLLLLFIGILPALTPEPHITIDARLNCPVVSSNGGTAYLQVTVTAPALQTDARRRPLNLAVVIDRSGSMGDQHKMEHAKKAFSALIDQLQPEDILSLVVYDDAIDVLRHARKVGVDKLMLKRILSEISPRGSTNLGGGLMRGLDEAGTYSGKGYVNRVVLLSDGLANVGMTDPEQLGSIVRSARNRSISVTTMGVGLDYNENLMMALAENGGGTYYFIEHPEGLAAIVRKEFAMAASVIAQNATLYLTPGDGVQSPDVVGCAFGHENAQVVIPVGDLAANETREITVELTIPAGRGSRSIVTGELRYESTMLGRPFPTFSASVRYSDDLAEVERRRDLQAQSKADIALSSRIVEKAMQSMDAGDHAAAQAQLNDAQQQLANSPAAASSGPEGSALRARIMKYSEFKQEAKEGTDTRKAKKSIQYDNYRARTNK